MKQAGLRAGIVLFGGILLSTGDAARSETAGEPSGNPELREAVLRFEAGDDKATEPFFRNRLADRPDDAMALYYLGRIHFRRDQPDEAIDMFSRAVDLRPDDSTYHLWLGKACLAQLQEASLFRKMGLSKNVRAEYGTAIVLDPDNLEARKSLAGYLLEAPSIAGGSEGEAMKQVGEIRRRDPIAAHHLLGAHYLGDEEYRRAGEEFRAALELDSERPETHYWLGMLHQQQEEYAEAFAAFETALAFDPEAWDSLYQIGRTASLSDETLERGAEALRRYIEAGYGSDLPSPAWAYYRLGLIQQRGGDITGARRSFETALTFDPKPEEAKKTLKTFR